MMRPKILRSKKAISPILATLLLVVIAVSAIVMTYAWVTSFQSGIQSQAEVRPYKANIAFLDKGKTITIDIGNSGDADTKINGVYIGTEDANAVSQKPTPVLPISLKADTIVSFKVTYTWVAGETYYFKIVTEAGQPITFQEDAPQ